MKVIRLSFVSTAHCIAHHLTMTPMNLGIGINGREVLLLLCRIFLWSASQTRSRLRLIRIENTHTWKVDKSTEATRAAAAAETAAIDKIKLTTMYGISFANCGRFATWIELTAFMRVSKIRILLGSIEIESEAEIKRFNDYDENSLFLYASVNWLWWNVVWGFDPNTAILMRNSFEFPQFARKSAWHAN